MQWWEKPIWESQLVLIPEKYINQVWERNILDYAIIICFITWRPAKITENCDVQTCSKKSEKKEQVSNGRCFKADSKPIETVRLMKLKARRHCSFLQHFWFFLFFYTFIWKSTHLHVFCVLFFFYVFTWKYLHFFVFLLICLFSMKILENLRLSFSKYLFVFWRNPLHFNISFLFLIVFAFPLFREILCISLFLRAFICFRNVNFERSQTWRF